MKKLLFVALWGVLFIEKAEAQFTKWHIAMGPVISNSMPGQVGTKYNITFGIRKDVSEKINRIIFYDGNFNSASQGASAIASINLGFQFLTLDRGAQHSPFIHASIGYGGGNRYIDSAPVGAVGFGMEFFRKENYSLEIMYRKAIVITRATTQVQGMPSVDQIKMGINF